MPEIFLFPTNDATQEIKDGFYQMQNFPGVIGCVDGTRVDEETN